MNLSERVLGRRVVNYLKNEALVGRINKQKIKVSIYFYDFFYFLTRPSLFGDKEHLSKKFSPNYYSPKKFFH